MNVEERVLVAVMNRPKDLELAHDEGWYRIPEKHGARGASFEYVAFYFTSAFGEQGWAVHYYARCLGYELATRRDLLPDEADHPRAGALYFKLQLGPLQKREPPIVSQRWRRVTFIYTTWDRFRVAEEINDLYAEGDEFVDRLYHALRETKLAPERFYAVREAGVEYVAGLAVPCRDSTLTLDVSRSGSGAELPGSLRFAPKSVEVDPEGCLRVIRSEVEQRGGILPLPRQSRPGRRENKA